MMEASTNYFYKGLHVFTKICGAIAFVSFLIGSLIKNELIGNVMVYVFGGSLLFFVLWFISFFILKIVIKIKNKTKESRYQTYQKSIPNTLLEKEKVLANNFEIWYNAQKNNIDSFLLIAKKKAWKINIVELMVFAINIAIGIFFIYLFGVKNFYFDYVLILIDVIVIILAVSIPTLFIQFIWQSIFKQKLIKKIYYEDNIHFKQKIIPTLLKSFSENFKYQPEYGIYRDEFFESMFDFNSIDKDRYNSEDLISTENDDSFKLAECKIERQKKLGGKGGLPYYKSLFHGFMMIIKPQTNNKKWLMVGPHVESLLEKTDNLINLENDLYDSLYLTFSNDPIFARKVLTPKFIELLLLFHYYAEGKDCYFSFVGNKVFIALNSTSRKSESFLEFEGKTSISKEKLFYYYKILNMYSSFYKDFMNKKI